jgi:plasmid maintenance system killer protein
MTERIQNENYNDVMKKLQDYILDEANIKKALEMKFSSTNNKALNGKESNKVTYEKEALSKKPSIFIPREKDTLFWCFYLMKHGDAKYEMLEHKNILTEKNLKIEYVEKIRKEKQTVKTYKFATLTHIENNLANENQLDVKTFLTLCAVENLNVLFVKNKTYYELLMNDTNELHTVHLLQNYKYGHEINPTGAEQIKTTLYKLDNIDKSIKSMSGYKLSELVEICEKLAIETVNKDTNKSKNKKDLYEAIIQYF